jgi:lysophospholipase L1-like esterase
MKGYPLHTALTIALAALLLDGLRLVVPAIHGPDFSQLAAIVNFTPEGTPLSPLARHSEPALDPPPRTRAQPVTLLEDANHGLDHFYQALWRTERREPGAVTRIVHYGDSPTTADLVTGDVRRLLQKRFGDAGHGFILVAKPWAWYQHRDVQLTATGWQDVPASRFEARDGLFGLGGVSFTGSANASTSIVLENRGHSRFEVWYLRQPEGGVFTFWADGRQLGSVDTGGSATEPGFAPFVAEDGASELELRVEHGPVRVFGITAEKAGPGVVYDSLGLNGASITVLSRMFNQEHWAEELRHRNPDLVVVNYGTNEADFASFIDNARLYERELRTAIGRLRQALPEASVLVMSPMDRGARTGPGVIETMATIPRIVAIERRVARETGCGFFDTFAAMGGEGTMARWYTAQPRLVSADLIHPYPEGGRMIAAIIARETSAGLNRYKMRHVPAAAKSLATLAPVP